MWVREVAELIRKSKLSFSGVAMNWNPGVRAISEENNKVQL